MGGVMAPLTIFTDLALDHAGAALLERGLAPHVLRRAERTPSSVLSSSASSLDGVDIAFGQPDPARVLASGTLRWVQVTSAGYTRYDTPEFRATAAARGLVVSNSSSVYDEPCAEHALAFILAQTRQLPRALRSPLPNGSAAWHRLRGDCRLLRDQRVVMLGYGAIARRLAAVLAPFEMRVAALRRSPRGDEAIPIVTRDTLPAALAGADHVVNLLPDNAGSRGFVNADLLAQVKPGAVLYNVGRGTTVDQAALVGALRSGRLAAAWLDVTDPEPLPADHPLRALECCHITPHVAGGRRDEADALVRHFLANLRRFLDGAPLHDRVM
jgi:phosphoglycerate dehydrogenase-like enzyme